MLLIMCQVANVIDTMCQVASVIDTMCQVPSVIDTMCLVANVTDTMCQVPSVIDTMCQVASVTDTIYHVLLVMLSHIPGVRVMSFVKSVLLLYFLIHCIAACKHCRTKFYLQSLVYK